MSSSHSGGTDNMIHKFDATQFQLLQSSNAERPIDSLSYRVCGRTIYVRPGVDSSLPLEHYS